MLQQSDQPLGSAYDLAVLDLDGVVYVGNAGVPAAPDALARVRKAGMQLAFVTNNAARPPGVVASHLVELGVPAEGKDVVTSAQAAARLVARRAERGAAVFVIGGEGLEVALRERGLMPVTRSTPDVMAVVQGYSPRTSWQQVVDGALLIRSGLPWVASNTDMTMPTAGGPGPGSGTLVKLIADYADRIPEVAGKPEPALFEETLERVGGTRPLVVGDRLDTDIAGAVRMGWDSLLVFTGVTGLLELVAAPPGERPTYLGVDLAALGRTHDVPECQDGRWQQGGWAATVRGGSLAVEGGGAPDDWWRVVAAAGWQYLDEVGDPVDVSGLQPPSTDNR